MADQNDDLADDLDEFLGGDYHFAATEDEQQLAPIEDEATVDRMLRRRHRMLTERARVTDVASAEVRRIREWEQDRTAGIDQQLVWLNRGLEQYARQTLPARKIKSLALPNGTLKLTQPGAPSVVVTDLSEFVAWATDEAHPDRDALLRRTVDVEKADAKRVLQVGPADESDWARDNGEASGSVIFLAVDADGVTVPGLRFQKPAQARFTVAPPVDTGESPDKEQAE